MKNWRKLALAGSVLLPSLMMASEASAVVCAVNAHVIQRTIELEQKVQEVLKARYCQLPFRT